MASIVAAAAAAAAALQAVNLFLQAVEFLLSEVALALGFLKGAEHAVEVAHDRFEAVADAIDLTAKDAIGGTFAFVASAAAITVPVAVAAATVITAVTATVARWIAINAGADGRGRFAVGFGSFFVKFVGFVWFVGGGFRSAFAFRSFVHSGWNIFVFVAGTIFALAIIVVRAAGFFTVSGVLRVTFARWAIVIAIAAN